MLTVTASPESEMASSCHDFVRTNPCAGALGLSALSPNHGKQIGTPPRIAMPSCQRDFELTKSTSSAPAGFHEVTWAPCKYISPLAAGEVTHTFGKPPLPATTWAMRGIPKPRLSSAIEALFSIWLRRY